MFTCAALGLKKDFRGGNTVVSPIVCVSTELEFVHLDGALTLKKDLRERIPVVSIFCFFESLAVFAPSDVAEFERCVVMVMVMVTVMVMVMVMVMAMAEAMVMVMAMAMVIVMVMVMEMEMDMVIVMVMVMEMPVTVASWLLLHSRPKNGPL